MKWPVWTLLIRCSLASVLAETRTKPEPSLREFRDPNGRLFRLNLKTGATEWEDEKSQRSNAAGAELEDWLGGSDPAAEEVRQDLALDLGMRPATAGSLRGEKRPGQASAALKSLKAKVETKPSEQKMLESQADKKSVKRSGSVVTATSRVRDRAWAQAQQKVPESDGSKTEPGITTRHGSYGSYGIHGAQTGASGAFPSSDRELLNRGKKLLAKLEKEELAMREKPLK